MTQSAFPSAPDLLRSLEPRDWLDSDEMRWYAKAFDFVFRLWPALDIAAAEVGGSVSEELYTQMKSLEGIGHFVVGHQSLLEAEALADYLQSLPAEPTLREAAHLRSLAKVDAAVLMSLPANEIYARLSSAKNEAQRQATLVASLVDAVDRFVSVCDTKLPVDCVEELHQLMQARGQVALSVPQRAL
jgi:hypothetical protein